MKGESVNTMLNADLEVLDGDFGRCKDCLFEEDSWVIRYLAIDTHKWLPFGHKLVISPISVDLTRSVDGRLFVELTRDQIKNSPPLAEHEPVSRKYEKSLFEYYGYGQYWGGLGLWGAFSRPNALIGVASDSLEEALEDGRHLRSVRELEHYRVKCGEQTVGHVIDFLFNKDTWAVSTLVVETENWPRGQGRRLLPVADITNIDWSSRAVFTSLTASKVVDLPEAKAAV